MTTGVLDVDGFVDEDFESVPATRHTQSGTRDDKGRWVANAESDVPYTVNLQIVTDRELINLGVGGERTEDYRKLYINNGDLFSLTPQDEWSFTAPDLTGQRFSVYKMDNRPWRNYCKCVIVRIDS